MVVYWEYAFAENFILDGLLVYLALKCARARVSPWRLLLASGVGAAEAVLFPLLSFPVWGAYIVKIAGGLLIAVIAVGRERLKTYFVTVAAFFLLTFALGGLLVAAYSFFGVEYEQGNGFFVERAPVGLVLGAAGAFGVCVEIAAKAVYRYRRLKRNLMPVTLSSEKKRVRVTGFADSGNLLRYRGKPVSVISAVTALALFRGEKEAGRISVTTVNGTAEKPVFVCRMEVEIGSKRILVPEAYVTVGDVDTKDYKISLHTAMTEDGYETLDGTQRMAAKAERKRKRRKLLMRK